MEQQAQMEQVHVAAPQTDRTSGDAAVGSQSVPSAMVIKAAREMVRIHAEACNVNKDDLWAIEGQSFIDEAQSVLDACGATSCRDELVKALTRAVLALAHVSQRNRMYHDDYKATEAALAKATGSRA